MKPFLTIATHVEPDGTIFTLHEHDGRFYLHVDGRELMSTVRTYSEELLAEAGLAALFAKGRPAHPKVIIAGLGLGFTLKRCLELVGTPATVEVAELLPQTIEWNRTHLAEVNGHALADKRTQIHQGDFFDRLTSAGKNAYDALLFDIDEGENSLVVPGNQRMWSDEFYATVHGSLKPGGCAAFWLAEQQPSLIKQLKRAGFTRIEDLPAKTHPKARKAWHHIYIGRK